MSPAPPRMPRPRGPDGTRRLGQFTTLSFLSFCGIFAAGAILLDRSAQKPTSTRQHDVPNPNHSDIWMKDGSEITPPPAANAPQNGNPDTEDPQPDQPSTSAQPDYFNRHQRVRVPFVLRSMASAGQAQSRAQANAAAQSQRQRTKEERMAATQAKQQDLTRRQQEMERFTESRRLAHDLSTQQQQQQQRDQTPRGRLPERPAAGSMRQRSVSSGSSASDSSFSDFWDERAR